MKFTVHGCSDDLVDFEGDVYGEVGTCGCGVEVSIGPPGRCAILTIWYARPGTDAGVWEASIRQNAEGEPLPGSFTIRRCDNTRKGEAGYSVMVEVEVPDRTPVFCRRVPMPEKGTGVPDAWVVPS